MEIKIDSKLPIQNKSEIKDVLFLKQNIFKQCLFIVLNVICLLIPLFVFHLFPNLNKYLYDVVEEIEQADFVFLIYKSKEREVIRIQKNDFRVIP